MQGFESILTFIFVLFVAKTVQCFSSNFDFERMAYRSDLFFIRSLERHYPELFLEANKDIAVFKSKNDGESIKVLYPARPNTTALFDNEIKMLKTLKVKFKNKPAEKGIVECIKSDRAKWKNWDDAESLPGFCSVIVYTYGIPLFPVLRGCVQNNNRKMLFWYFSQMAKCMDSILSVGNIFHNNIGPDVFRLTADGTVVVDNFEIARYVNNPNRNFIYVAENGFPIGFKPTMSESGINAKKRSSACQVYSFQQTSYYILDERLPWQMDAIDFLWNVNIAEARTITFILQKINLEKYFEFRGKWNPIHSMIFKEIKICDIYYAKMSEQFLSMCDECPNEYSSYILPLI